MTVTWCAQPNVTKQKQLPLLISVTHPVVVELLAALADGVPVVRDVFEVSFHLDHKVPEQSGERS